MKAQSGVAREERTSILPVAGGGRVAVVVSCPPTTGQELGKKGPVRKRREDREG